MLPSHRVIWKDGGTLRDISSEMMNFLSGTQVIDFTAATDAIYLGSEMPFNHRWLELSVVSDTASVATARIWGAQAWNDVAETKDLTAVSGVSLARSGIIYFTRDRLKVWDREQSTEDIPELASLKIYDLYWVELKWSANWKATTALKYVGHKFSNDEDLVAEYPSLGLSNRKTAFQAGKTNWDDQHFTAAEYVINDLTNRDVIESSSQILDWRPFRNAAVHKCAEIIFRAFGDDYKDDLERANKAYNNAMRKGRFDVDQNMDGVLNDRERQSLSRFITR